MGKQMNSSKVNDREVESAVGDLSAARAERGARIKAIREASGMTAADFAKACGVTEVTQYNYEKGSRVPGADYLSELYFHFAVDLGPLVTGAPRAKGIKVSGEVEEMLHRYEVLPTALRKTVDDVLFLAWRMHQSSRS